MDNACIILIMRKAWEGVFTAIPRKRGPWAGLVAYAPKLALWFVQLPPRPPTQKRHQIWCRFCVSLVYEKAALISAFVSKQAGGMPVFYGSVFIPPSSFNIFSHSGLKMFPFSTSMGMSFLMSSAFASIIGFAFL